MAREQKRRQTIGGGEEPILWRDSREGFQRFLGEIVVTLVSSVSVHADERDNRCGVCARGGRILEGLAAYVQPAQRPRVRWPVKKHPAPGRAGRTPQERKNTRLNSSHPKI